MYLQSIQWYQAKSISDSVGFTSLLTVRMGASSHSWSASSTSTFITHCWSQPSLQKSNFTESTLHRAIFYWQRQKVKPHYFDVGVKRNMYERLDHYGNDNSILDGNNQLARKCGSDCSSLLLIWEIIPVTLKNNTQRTKNTPSRLGEYLCNSKALNREKERCLAGWALLEGIWTFLANISDFSGVERVGIFFQLLSNFAVGALKTMRITLAIWPGGSVQNSRKGYK